MNITVARSGDWDGLYVDGRLYKEAPSIDLDDIYMAANKQPFELTIKYLNDDCVLNSGYLLPWDEKDLVELDS